MDTRVWTTDEAECVENAVRAYRASNPLVSIHINRVFERPPLTRTPGSHALYLRALRIAAELGFELGAARVGGASDGNLIAAAGVPTLDGLGPKGGGAHAREEFIVVSDLPRRAALLARFVSEQE
ncbi:MAG: M20/M25/M40 family metallo-hydrolase [Thermoanaerobaculia bacterium]